MRELLIVVDVDVDVDDALMPFKLSLLSREEYHLFNSL